MEKYSLMIGDQKVADIDLSKSAEIEMQSAGWDDVANKAAFIQSVCEFIEKEWAKRGLPKGKYSLEFEI